MTETKKIPRRVDLHALYWRDRSSIFTGAFAVVGLTATRL